MSAPVTKQHLKIIDEIRVGDRCMRFDITDAQAAQLIADSEAKATVEIAMVAAASADRNVSLRLERDQLRADCNNLRADLDAIKAIRDEEKARAASAEREVERLNRDYDYDHKCLHEVRERCELWKQRAERAEADLATAKAIIASIEEDGTEEHNAAVRLRQELATERARLDWLMAGGVCMVQHSGGFYVSRLHAQVSRAAIDSAMKEESA